MRAEETRMRLGLSSVIGTILDGSVPARLANDPDEWRRASLVSRTVTVMFLLASLMVTQYVAKGVHVLVPAVLGVLVALGLLLILLRATGWYRLVAHGFCAVYLVTFFVLMRLTGGLESPTLPSNATIVLLAVMLLGVRGGLGWTLAFVATYVAHYELDSLGIATEQVLPPSEILPTRLAEICAASIGVAAIASIYEWTKQHMLSRIRDQTARVEIAHVAQRRILDNVGQGLLTVDGRGRIIGERSRKVDEWFGHPEPGEPFHALLRRHDECVADAFELGWEAMAEDLLPTELCLDQLPKRLQVGSQHFALEVRRIEDPGAEQWMIIISDITAHVKQERDEQRQRDLMQAFGRILDDREGFATFVDEAQDLLNTIRSDDVGLVERRRALHTLKGNAALVGASSLAETCHRIEDEVHRSGGLSSSSAEMLADEVEVVRAWLAPFDLPVDERVALSRSEHQAFLHQLEMGIAPAELVDQVRHWDRRPVAHEFNRLAQHANRLAVQLDRGELRVGAHDGGIRFPVTSAWRGLWFALVHAVRNAVDHGLEPASERASVGKGPPGIDLRAVIERGQLRIEVADDGRGVSWDKVRARAKDLGLRSDCHAALVEAIVSDRFSTKEGVTAISGRGIGMSALADAVRPLGGTIDVLSEPGRGTIVRLSFDAKAVGVKAIPDEAPDAPPRISRPEVVETIGEAVGA